jgi:uncharacterized GH25 family protein
VYHTAGNILVAHRAIITKILRKIHPVTGETVEVPFVDQEIRDTAARTLNSRLLDMGFRWKW